MSGLDFVALLGPLFGGVGLFLLGMGMMTDGLKTAAGPALEQVVARSTRTRLHGLATGALMTAAVQSSSAGTVAAIGFVNAGLPSLSQALWVLFGGNVGTTFTGWLVALVRLRIKVEAFALPLIGLGAAARLFGRRPAFAAAGQAVAGFGLLFLGIGLLQQSFLGLADEVVLPSGEGVLGALTMVGIGAALTVVMQASAASAASIALALAAAQSGLIDVQAAAAVVIGANVGTTATAVIAAIGATPNARRAAAAHVLFNVLAVPELALDALRREVRRSGAIAVRIVRGALAGAAPAALARDRTLRAGLDGAIERFVERMHRAAMSVASSERLPRILRVARYHEACADLAFEAATAPARRCSPRSRRPTRRGFTSRS
jgi:Na/Pi-cotransporter